MVITGGEEGYFVPRSERRLTVSPRDHLRFLNAVAGIDQQSIDDLTRNNEGAYTIISMNITSGNGYKTYQKYTGENAREEALAQATLLTRTSMDIASDAIHLATVYRAYDPQGKYIGGAE